MRRFLLCTALGLALAGCTEGGSPESLTADGQPIVDATVGATTSVKLVDRDVEAPDIFSAEGEALWDGRPSLGGVWVASPDATDPERVIMRNPANGKFVIGALFRREAANPGPKLQISSDAADALGILAGDPTRITVTALRREEAPVVVPDANAPLLATAETVGAEEIAADTAKAIATTPAPAAPAAEAATATTDATAEAAASPAPASGGFLGGLFKPAAPAAAPATTEGAITTAPLDATAPAATTATAASAPAATATTTPAAPKATGGLIQVGTFSVEANAQRAVDILKKAGIASTIHTAEASGKPYWYVTVAGDAAMLAKVKAAGFTDAYQLKK